MPILIISSIALAGCGYTPEQRGVSGAALGGATGAGRLRADDDLLLASTVGGAVTVAVAADGAADDFFGYSVGISFDTAIVGAYGSDTNTFIDRGASYIYRTASGSWTQQDKLQNSSEGDRQGYSVAISGDTAADLEVLKEMIAAETLRHVIDRRYPLDRIAEAHAYVETRHRRGAVVISPVA